MSSFKITPIFVYCMSKININKHFNGKLALYSDKKNKSSYTECKKAKDNYGFQFP